ncbi:hypothetical protein B0H15DRAFT_801414 [Mycena belliarum]|uniref:Uncharacterized protein n=1 Tax=Mycena belliarum TaxID=1033014 RepID=A0AAD6U1Y3_9AGAR|nr:hypothetical protein B0H15DRAFT_801414 [Mycena belliae]
MSCRRLFTKPLQPTTPKRSLQKLLVRSFESTRNRRPRKEKSSDLVGLQNKAPGRPSAKDTKKKHFKLTAGECLVLTEAVWDADPFSAPHGDLLKRWDSVAESVHSQGYLMTMKVPAIRATTDKLLGWHHDPEADEGAHVDEVLKGMREAVSMGALLDHISEAKERAEGRTEEQKVKAVKKDEYDKRGGEAIRLNSMKNMRRQGSPAAPTSPRHYVPPKKTVINVDSDAETDRGSSPVGGSTPEVEELPPPKKRKHTASSRGGGTGRHKRSRFCAMGGMSSAEPKGHSRRSWRRVWISKTRRSASKRLSTLGS